MDDYAFSRSYIRYIGISEIIGKLINIKKKIFFGKVKVFNHKNMDIFKHHNNEHLSYICILVY